MKNKPKSITTGMIVRLTKLAKLQDYEIEEQYKDMLDECYPTIMIAGVERDYSRILIAIDPIAYRVGLSDYEATVECSDCNEVLSDCICEGE
jgi:hypothetical protein